jgi:ABC-type sulfate transport system permease subunit
MTAPETQMNLSTTISSSAKKTRASLPWGRWGVRSVALAYLTFMLVIPLLVILRDGTQEGLAEMWRQVTLPRVGSEAHLLDSAVMTVINTIWAH